MTPTCACSISSLDSPLRRSPSPPSLLHNFLDLETSWEYNFFHEAKAGDSQERQGWGKRENSVDVGERQDDAPGLVCEDGRQACEKGRG